MVNRKLLIIELREQRKTYQQIADYLGVSRQRVHQILKDYHSTDKSVRHMALQRDNHKCLICDSSKNLEIHHINGIKGDDRSDNLATLCRKCHHRIEKKDRETWKGQPEKILDNRKPTFYEKDCRQCFKHFKTRRKNSIFCSWECMNKFRSLSPEERKKRHADRMKKLRQKYLADPIMREKMKKWGKQANKKYYKKNREKIQKYQTQLYKKRYQTDPIYREKMKARFREYYKRKKGEKTLEDIAKTPC